MRTIAGLGDALQQAQQAVSVAGSTAAAVEGAGVALIPGLTASVAVPIIGIGVTLVTLAISLIENSGCGETCIITADDANKVEPYLQANIDGYFKGPRTQSSQATALANFLYFWNYLLQACGNPQLGNAGKNCISDRQAGACTWKATASTTPYPGEPGPGQCWNWWNGYHDPIANDPNIVPDSAAVIDATTGTIPTTGGGATLIYTDQSSVFTSPFFWGAVALGGAALISGMH